MRKIRNGSFINLRYFCIIFVIAFGLITFIGCSSSDDPVPPVAPVVPDVPDVVDNSSFWGDYTFSVTTEPCELEISTPLIIGGDSTRKNEYNYIYVPKDQLSGTYTKVDPNDPLDVRTITIVRNGLTIDYTEDGIDYITKVDLVYSNDYNSFTINGEAIDDFPDQCEGTVTGKGIRVGSVGVTIGYNYLQYRSPGGQYTGWIDVYKDGIPPEAADIAKVELKDSNDDIVDITVSPLLVAPIYYGRWNDQTSTVDFSGPTFYSGFGISFPGGFELPADDYTWEVTTSEDVVVPKPISYPGIKELPAVDSATMESVWDEGNLILSWVNPPNIAPGDYEELWIILKSDKGHGLYAYLPPDKNELTIPSDWVDGLGKYFEPLGVDWIVITRSYTDPPEDMNYARGYSNWVPIPEPPP